MLLSARNILKIYTQGAETLRVLKGIDIDIDEGQVLSIIGPSGAGKSTLLHILGGLDAPQVGQVIFDGRDLYGLSENELSRLRNGDIGFVFQFYHLLAELSALENVLLPALIKKNSRRTRALEEESAGLLERVGLKERLQHRPYQLSGGEQQRVAIARALMNRPKIIFCDEPTGNLDSETGKAIIEILLELNAKGKQTLVVVTHDDTIARRSHRVVHIRDGKLEIPT